MNKELVAYLVALFCVAGFMLPIVQEAKADDIEVEWVVPADTTISVSYPTSETNIEFDATTIGMDFNELGATSQASDTAALKITNEGNTPLDITWHLPPAFAPVQNN